MKRSGVRDHNEVLVTGSDGKPSLLQLRSDPMMCAARIQVEAKIGMVTCRQDEWRYEITGSRLQDTPFSITESKVNKTQIRVVKVLKNMIRMAEDDEAYAEMFAYLLNDTLDFARDDDAFGTEGQCDPRGDGRSGEWSMYKVEGIDE